MNLHFTSFLLDLKELVISNVENVHGDFFIHVQPIDYLQNCPQCQGENVIRKGSSYQRKVRHLSAFGRLVFLLLPAIRMMCKQCATTFSGSMRVWHLENIRQNRHKLQRPQWNVFLNAR